MSERVRPRSRERSPEADAWQSWYKTAEWARIRNDQLSKHPLCALCLQRGKHRGAVICDHIHAHKGDRQRFYSGPFQSLCKPCHDRYKQAQERNGFMAGSDAKGWPLDPNHPWNVRDRANA